MIVKRICLAFGVLSSACLLMGSSTCNPEETWEMMLDPEAAEKMMAEPEYVVTVHQIVKYPRAEMLEKAIPSYFGDSVIVNQNYYISSKEIEKIELLERKTDPGFYDLKLTFTSRGQKMWIGLSVNNRRNQLAFVIDGMHYRNFEPRLIMDDEDLTVIVDGPFDVATANALQKNSESNFKKLNKR